MRCPVARILGCTGFPALRLRILIRLGEFVEPSSLSLLSVRDSVLSELKLSLSVSSRLCTPNELPPMVIREEVVFCCVFALACASCLDGFRPLS